MRVRYKSVCVKFREDDPLQMKAWEYLQSEGNKRSYSRIIAEALVGESNPCISNDTSTAMHTTLGIKESLDELKGICNEILSHVIEGGKIKKIIPSGIASVKSAENIAGMSSGIMDMVMGMSDDDE